MVFTHFQRRVYLGNSLRNMEFYERYQNHTDGQILEILKNRKDYQEAAAEAAIRIAIERQLINSEQDLFSSEFQNVKSNGNKLFPELSNAYHRQRLVASIFRFLYILSFLPAVFGFINYVNGQLPLSFLAFGVASIWFLLSFLLFKNQNVVFFIPLIFMLFSVSAFIGVKIFTHTPFIIWNLVLLLIVTLIVVYLLLFLKKLIQYNAETK